jgi:hypothetical protein
MFDSRVFSDRQWYLNLNPTQLYRVSNLAKLSALSCCTIRRLFRDETGVLKISHRRRGTRLHEMLRIPGSVAIRKFQSLTNGGSE